MDPKPPPGSMLLAPSSGRSSLALQMPAQHPARPAPPPIDDPLVTPETTREEWIGGRRIEAAPAMPPHGDRHFGLDYVLGAHVQEGYVGSTDLLTRVAENSNFATDTCIRRRGTNPETGTRYLEEIAFEVVNEQSIRDITDKARELNARGVRRVLAIFVKKGEVREWSTERGEWERLDPKATVSDPTLTRPLRVAALLEAAEADNSVARALLAKNNPVLAENRRAGHRAGHREGRRDGRREALLEAIEATCELLEVPLDVEARQQLEELAAEEIERVFQHLRTHRRLP